MLFFDKVRVIVNTTLHYSLFFNIAVISQLVKPGWNKKYFSNNLSHVNAGIRTYADVCSLIYNGLWREHAVEARL
jgi:hypothetical protein